MSTTVHAFSYPTEKLHARPEKLTLLREHSHIRLSLLLYATGKHPSNSPTTACIPTRTAKPYTKYSSSRPRPPKNRTHLKLTTGSSTLKPAYLRKQPFEKLLSINYQRLTIIRAHTRQFVNRSSLRLFSGEEPTTTTKRYTLSSQYLNGKKKQNSVLRNQPNSVLRNKLRTP